MRLQFQLTVASVCLWPHPHPGFVSVQMLFCVHRSFQKVLHVFHSGSLSVWPLPSLHSTGSDSFKVRGWGKQKEQKKQISVLQPRRKMKRRSVLPVRLEPLFPACAAFGKALPAARWPLLCPGVMASLSRVCPFPCGSTNECMVKNKQSKKSFSANGKKANTKKKLLVFCGSTRSGRQSRGAWQLTANCLFKGNAEASCRQLMTSTRPLIV